MDSFVNYLEAMGFRNSGKEAEISGRRFSIKDIGSSSRILTGKGCVPAEDFTYISDFDKDMIPGKGYNEDTLCTDLEHLASGPNIVAVVYKEELRQTQINA